MGPPDALLTGGGTPQPPCGSSAEGGVLVIFFWPKIDPERWVPQTPLRAWVVAHEFLKRFAHVLYKSDLDDDEVEAASMDDERDPYSVP